MDETLRAPVAAAAARRASVCVVVPCGCGHMCHRRGLRVGVGVGVVEVGSRHTAGLLNFRRASVGGGVCYGGVGGLLWPVASAPGLSGEYSSASGCVGVFDSSSVFQRRNHHRQPTTVRVLTQETSTPSQRRSADADNNTATTTTTTGSNNNAWIDPTPPSLFTSQQQLDLVDHISHYYPPSACTLPTPTPTPTPAAFLTNWYHSHGNGHIPSPHFTPSPPLHPQNNLHHTVDPVSSHHRRDNVHRHAQQHPQLVGSAPHSRTTQQQQQQLQVHAQVQQRSHGHQPPPTTGRLLYPSPVASLSRLQSLRPPLTLAIEAFAQPFRQPAATTAAVSTPLPPTPISAQHPTFHAHAVSPYVTHDAFHPHSTRAYPATPPTEPVPVTLHRGQQAAWIHPINPLWPINTMSDQQAAQQPAGTVPEDTTTTVEVTNTNPDEAAQQQAQVEDHTQAHQDTSSTEAAVVAASQAVDQGVDHGVDHTVDHGVDHSVDHQHLGTDASYPQLSQEDVNNWNQQQYYNVGGEHALTGTDYANMNVNGVMPLPGTEHGGEHGYVAENDYNAVAATLSNWAEANSVDNGNNGVGMVGSDGTAAPLAEQQQPNGEVPVGAAPVPEKPKKLVLACHFCRGRKLKCDGGRPTCGHCAKRNLECTYDEQVRRRGPGKRTKEMRERAAREAEAAGMGLNAEQLAEHIAAAGAAGPSTLPEAPKKAGRKRKSEAIDEAEKKQRMEEDAAVAAVAAAQAMQAEHVGHLEHGLSAHDLPIDPALTAEGVMDLPPLEPGTLGQVIQQLNGQHQQQ